MATDIKPKSKAKSSNALNLPTYHWLEKLFRLPAPDKVRGRDGKTYIITHRYGADGGAYTRDALFEMRYESELGAYQKQLSRTYSKASIINENLESRKHKLRGMLDSNIMRLKWAVKRQYNEIGLISIAGFMKIVSDQKPKLFIAGWVNERFEPVIGDVNDHALWTITTLKATKGLDRARQMALALSKKVLNLSNVNRDVKKELSLVLSEE